LTLLGLADPLRPSPGTDRLHSPAPPASLSSAHGLLRPWCASGQWAWTPGSVSCLMPPPSSFPPRLPLPRPPSPRPLRFLPSFARFPGPSPRCAVDLRAWAPAAYLAVPRASSALHCCFHLAPSTRHFPACARSRARPPPSPSRASHRPPPGPTTVLGLLPLWCDSGPTTWTSAAPCCLLPPLLVPPPLA
jgi:hypothetical protein